MSPAHRWGLSPTSACFRPAVQDRAADRWSRGYAAAMWVYQMGRGQCPFWGARRGAGLGCGALRRKLGGLAPLEPWPAVAFERPRMALPRACDDRKKSDNTRYFSSRDPAVDRPRAVSARADGERGSPAPAATAPRRPLPRRRLPPTAATPGPGDQPGDAPAVPPAPVGPAGPAGPANPAGQSWAGCGTRSERRGGKPIA